LYTNIQLLFIYLYINKNTVTL